MRKNYENVQKLVWIFHYLLRDKKARSFSKKERSFFFILGDWKLIGLCL
jgi:hypothetical protein